MAVPRRAPWSRQAFRVVRSMEPTSGPNSAFKTWLGPNLVESDQCFGQNLSQCGTTSTSTGQFGPESAQCGPTSSDVGPTSAEFDLSSDKFGQTSPEFGRLRAEHSQRPHPAQLGPDSTKLGPSSGKIGPPVEAQHDDLGALIEQRRVCVPVKNYYARGASAVPIRTSVGTRPMQHQHGASEVHCQDSGTCALFGRLSQITVPWSSADGAAAVRASCVLFRCSDVVALLQLLEGDCAVIVAGSAIVPTGRRRGCVAARAGAGPRLFRESGGPCGSGTGSRSMRC